MSSEPPPRSGLGQARRLHLPWRRRAFQLALALCCFGAPLLALPLALSEHGSDAWVCAGLSESVVHELFIPEGSTALHYALAENQGVYRSTDYASSWQHVSSGLPSDRWGRVQVQTLAVDAANPSVLYAGRGDLGSAVSVLTSGLYWTDDAGATWLVSGAELAGNEVQAIVVMPSTTLTQSAEVPATPSTVWIATSSGIYRSGDRGRSWSRLDWRGVDTRILSLAVHPDDLDVILLGIQEGGLYRTHDGGATWEVVSGDLSDRSVLHIAIARGSGGYIYLGTDAGVYRSADLGVTWETMEGAPGGRVVNAIALDPQDGSFLCVGLQSGGAHCSTDGGRHWVELRRGLGSLSVYVLRLDPGDPSILWAGTSAGVWRYVFGAIEVPAVAPVPELVPSASPQPSPTYTVTPSRTATTTWTAVPSVTATPTATAGPTQTPTLPPTAYPTVTHTVGPAATQVPIPTSTLTPVPVSRPPQVPASPTAVLPSPTPTTAPR